MRSPSIAVLSVSLAASVALVALAGAVGSLRPDPAETFEPRGERPAPEVNRALEIREVAARGDAPRVVAWEEGRRRRPTFVLYADGRWLVDRLEREEGYSTGRLEADERERALGDFEALDLLALPPLLRLHPSAVDSNVYTLCVAHGSSWHCASADGMSPRSVEATSLAAVGTLDSAPAPPPLARARDRISALAGDERARPWIPRRFVLRCEGARVGSQTPEFLRTQAPWPASLPGIAVRPGAVRYVGTSPTIAREVEAYLAAHEGVALHVDDGHAVRVGAPTPELPGMETIRALARAHAAFLGLPSE